MDGGDASMDLVSALQDVLKEAIVCDGLVKGLHECTKVLDKRQALFCVLADNCDEQNYVKLVEALCREHSTPLIKFEDNKKLGELSGLCKLDKEGKPRKVVSCSCVVVKATNESCPGWEFLKNEFKIQV